MAASTFSYAQAAKGLSTPVAASKPASESGASTQDAPVNTSIRSVQSWADDAETDMVNEQNTAPQITKPIQSAQPIETPSISSPDLGASSSSTVTKDDDVSSLPNASSESTWDNKSQASTSVDKSVEPVEKTSDKAKKTKAAPAKPLQEAPLPAVNIWKKRAEELKSKVQKPEPVQVNGASNKKTEPETKGRATGKNQDDDRHTHGRKDTRAEGDARSKGRFSDKDAKAAANSLPPPPTRDQESWPTPDTAVDEDRKKAQDKGDKERKENPATASHGKQEWVKVPYTPSVVFSTPLPGATGSRRGGRPGGRGGSQPGGRGAGYASNGAGSSEKDAPGAAAANGEVKRDRLENGAFRDASPRSRRAGGASSPSHNTSAAAPVEKSSQASESDAPTKPQNGSEHGQASNQTGAYTRSYPNRSGKPRRGDFSNAGERRRDGEASPTKDNTFDDRRANNDASGDAERRHSSYHDGPNGHHKQGRFGAYSGGRDRARGGNRGGRGNFTNGHQYANGHMPSLQTSGSFPMGPRSPTTFNPENPSFFSANQGKYGRNGHRSQSVTTDAYRFTPYQNGSQVPPLQGYGMYDYSMMPQPPMSAVPYSPYVDHFALFAMITTQVEYYFSVDNLLKDMYLRKHMDSQGFVPFDTITNFSRIKQLSTDVELIKLVCQQSAVVEYRTGEDGQDRLRRRENWEQWVLNMADRDVKAQNEGPKELRHPPMPHVNGFEQANGAQWPMPVYGGDGSFPQMNGFAPAVGQDNAYEALPNGTASEKPQDNALPNGHSVEPATNA